MRFLVELYAPRSERTTAAARLRASDGPEVRLLSTIYVPSDETCFLLVEAPSEQAVSAELGRAHVAFDRLLHAIEE